MVIYPVLNTLRYTSMNCAGFYPKIRRERIIFHLQSDLSMENNCQGRPNWVDF